MKRFLNLFAFLALFACTNDPQTGVNETLPGAQKSDPYAVTVDDALSEMYSAMNVLYGSGTRTGSRTVASVETLKKTDLPAATRSSGAEFPEELVYIVNFQDGEGFAVLGAHQTMEPIYCITEGGSLSSGSIIEAIRSEEDREDDFLWDEEDDDYLLGSSSPSFIYAQLADAIVLAGGIKGPIDGDIPGPPADYRVEYSDWTRINSTKIGPLLTTKWSQGDHFNSHCYNPLHYLQNREKKYYPAGCWAIALAQVISFNEKPSPTFFGATSTWTELKNHEYTVRNPLKPSTAVLIEDQLSWIIRIIGDGVSMNYDYDGSGTTARKAKIYLKNDLNYKSVDKMNSYELSHITDMLNKRLPVLISGRRSGSGHAWVIDGSVTQKRTVRRYGGLILINTSTETRFLLHCNFGWGGTADGYYHSGVFKPHIGAVATDDGNSSGLNPESGHYDHRFRIIKYSR